jgi:hypothetical protein
MGDMTSTVPPGRGLSASLIQALRACVLSACPSGTEAIRPSKRHPITYGAIPWGQWREDKAFGMVLRPEGTGGLSPGF